jgi:hypothetical protein
MRFELGSGSEAPIEAVDQDHPLVFINHVTRDRLKKPEDERVECNSVARRASVSVPSPESSIINLCASESRTLEFKIRSANDYFQSVKRVLRTSWLLVEYRLRLVLE